MARKYQNQQNKNYRGSSTQRRRVNTTADAQLDRFIKNNPEGDRRNTEMPGLESILQDMSADRQAFVARNTNQDTGKMNQAAKAMVNFYRDDRPEYARQMNRLTNSSQPMADAYARRFPLTNFAMKMGPTIAGGMVGVPLGALEKGFDRLKQGGRYLKENIGPALSSGIDNTMKFAESGLDTGAQIVGDLANTGAQMSGDVRDKGVELLQDLTDKGINIFEQATAPNVEDLSFTVQNRPTGPRENTVNPLEKLLIDSGSVDTAGVERLFKLPRNFPGDFNNQYFTDIPDDSKRDNYLVRNPQSPYFEASQQPGTGLYGMNLNQGGLASLNNEDYMRLMGASNFGF